MTIDGPDALSAALRAISFALLLNAAGIPIFIVLFGRLIPNSLPDVTKLGRKLTIGALVFVVAQQALEAARMAGEMSGIIDPAMQKMALFSPSGAAFAVRVLGLVLVGVALRSVPPSAQRVRAAAPGSPTAVASPTALLGTLLTTASFTLIGHTTTTPHRAAAAALITLHLLVVAFWLGSLWPLYTAATKDPRARVIEKFSIIAAWVVPLILLAGIGLTALLLPDLAALKYPYGRLLLAKVAGFAVLLAMASLNKWHFGPACAAGRTAAFKRTVVVEYMLMCIVLAVTAAMTMFYSPEAGPEDAGGAMTMSCSREPEAA